MPNNIYKAARNIAGITQERATIGGKKSSGNKYA